MLNTARSRIAFFTSRPREGTDAQHESLSSITPAISNTLRNSQTLDIDLDALAQWNCE